MRKLILVFFLLFSLSSLYATHIAGGELYYEYVRPGTTATSKVYRVTLRLFRQCENTGGTGAQLSIETPVIGIYRTAGLSRATQVTLPRISITSISNNPAANPCLVGSTAEITSCYEVGIWSGEVQLDNSEDGYTLVWTRYTRRMSGVQNVNVGIATGATFVTRIPGNQQLPSGQNSSPIFIIRDTALICSNTSFTLDYSATDADGDSLSYKFAPAYEGIGGSDSNPDPFAASGPPANVTFIGMSYRSPFSASAPLGSGVSLNANTGVLTGVAPNLPGYYVLCVMVEEWRNGVKINEHRKDFILKIGNCSTVKPDAGPDDRTCDGFSFYFENQSPNPNIINYAWNFGDGNLSTQPTPTHTYADTGRYLVKLKVTATGGCQDSSSKFIYVYPGFTPNINVQGSCVQQPIRFFDATTTVYGFVNSWMWNFGDPTTLADTARSRDTAWKYPSASTYTVQLISTNSKGCEDTVKKVITVRDKPIISLPFRDTLICSIDTLPLIANTAGSITWTPNYNIINPTSPNPLVYPKDTTTYVITVNDDGCINSDSITVNVLDFITVDAGVDSVICRTDTIRLRPISHALSYIWTASTGEVVQPIKFPLVQPLAYTKYYVTANLGKCQDRDSVAITPVPYPQANANNVSPICFGDRVQLNATIVGSSFTWSPSSSLLNPTTLNPVAGPSATTAYIITAFDTLGCPKPFRDTVVVTVIPLFNVNAGRDTAVVRGQPLQLQATTVNIPATSSYLWSPATGLSNTSIANPIAIINNNIDSIKYRVRVTRPEGCFAEDEIVVRVFSTQPDIFIPTAFTPNGDGKNDVLRPITVGITQLDYFRVYNRWGQLLFESRENNKGWDGTINGTPQASGTYVYTAQGTDYTGKVITKKGTAVLIR